uniref:Conjugative transfer protein TrbF n=1 Tax=Vibrio parahaemolyticus TaxID=670 RepID=A0A1Y1BCN2_VIBPH|nr:VirB8/TrbF family protein [Vibrio parahaemolyticus]BAX56936.1 conjugative transfer protein TrbF [Vibrio parahaemolyticus]
MYQRAREEWDERLGSIVKQAHNWKMCAFFSMFVAAIAVGSTGYIGAQSKIEPYVIGVKNGEEVWAWPAFKSCRPHNWKRSKVNDLERFVEDIRSVYLDVEVEDKAVRRAYARLVPPTCANANLTGVQRREPV